MENKVQGKLKLKKDVQQITDSFKKREFVLTLEGDYPQDILFELTQENCSKIDEFQLGKTIEVSFNLRGREWTNPQGEVKYFNSLQVWKVEGVNPF